MRVKQFVQDDGHIFCRECDIVSETQEFCKMLVSVYKDFGFHSMLVKFATRPEKRAGNDETWDKAESLLKQGAELAGLQMEINEGEGAFYGPKLEFVIKDCVGRDWQCGTLQLDFVMPQRLNVKYVNENNEHVHPIMIHRAILGSMQRFIGILIEHYEGRFPLWLAPVQVAVVTLSQSEEIIEYAKNLKDELDSMGFRVILDDRNERLEYKIQHLVGEDKIPCLCIVGNREAKEDTVAVRVMSKNRVMTKDELFEFLKSKVAKDQNIYDMD
jgi:threonyl-tRNA synthetase